MGLPEGAYAAQNGRPTVSEDSEGALTRGIKATIASSTRDAQPRECVVERAGLEPRIITHSSDEAFTRGGSAQKWERMSPRSTAGIFDSSRSSAGAGNSP